MMSADLSTMQTLELSHFAEGYLMMGQTEEIRRISDELVRRALDAVAPPPQTQEAVLCLGALLKNPALPTNVRIELVTRLAHVGLLPDELLSGR
jgi:hypothetical protein